ncbi:hypothetical protein GCM10027275_17320 [Rhabdobacter roseus]|uniref:Putative neutral ceramidase superfamily lipid hydrolase n=1 Tax=Rhabdobacter roseus TaxID=1655419 RepID=A0A840THM3_9BACT|nr:hypothetical protein [Rhabdobacter roseus]MBB5283656.1 putative neutral ceramidase superfamily lipid hydrolase [Rhabdobacter roseus]
MTLRELFQYTSTSPWPILLLFILFPLLAWALGEAAHGSREVVKWGYVYAVLVYAVCIPGIFAVTLNLYLFLFERQSVWEANLLLQLVPVVSMVLTLLLIKRKIPFRLIPGFGKLSGFLTLIAALMGVMWFVDKVHFYAFTYVPFVYLLVGFVGALLLIRFAWSRLF